VLLETPSFNLFTLTRPVVYRMYCLRTACRFFARKSCLMIYIWASLGWFGSAITDVAITVALIWQLFTYRPTFQPTKRYAILCRFLSLIPLLLTSAIAYDFCSFIQRLVVMILQTGSASSLIAILVAMGFHIHGISIGMLRPTVAGMRLILTISSD
jgi:hypothetical protein